MRVRGGIGEGAGAVVQVEPVLPVEVPEDDVEVAVAVHVAQRHGTGGVAVGRHSCGGGIGVDAGAVVQVDPVLRTRGDVPEDDVEVAIAVHVAQRHGQGPVPGARDLCGGDIGEDAGAVVEVEPVSRIRPEIVAVVAEDHVEVAVAIHVAQRHGAGILAVDRHVCRGDIGVGASPVVQTGLYLNIKSPKLGCTIDFDPMGPWIGISNYGDNWSTSPYHDGKNVRFCMFCSGASNGATFTGKVVVRTGSDPYEAIHPNDPLAYTTDFPVALALNFTDTDTDVRYKACPPSGWRNVHNVRIVPRATGGFLRRDFATGDGEGVLDLDLAPGLYLLTLNVHDGKEATGRFTIADGNGVLVEDVEVPRGAYWDKSVPLRVRDGGATLRFRGAWKINALTAQLILRDSEDFMFERPYWNMDVDVE